MDKLMACVKESVFSAFKTGVWVLKIMVPVSFFIMLLKWSGVLQWVAQFLVPVFNYIGISGEGVFVYLTGFFVNIFVAIAVMETLALPMREVTILALMCLISHNIITETLVLKKCGSPFSLVLMVRVLAAFTAGIVLNFLLPGQPSVEFVSARIPWSPPVFEDLFDIGAIWVGDTLVLSVKVLLIIIGVMVLQNILKEYGILDYLTKIFNPLIKAMLLPSSVSVFWLIANTLGLAYGAAVLIDARKKGFLKYEDAKFLYVHVAINHSLLEDTLLYAAIGVPIFWITVPRVFLAVCAVAIYRAWNIVHRKLKNVR